MNILVPHSWLKDYIVTNATPKDIARVLSLHAFSVEKIIESEKDEKVYEIEITPNRGDALSVLGIARELRAILPRENFKVDWRERRVVAVEDDQDDQDEERVPHMSVNAALSDRAARRQQLLDPPARQHDQHKPHQAAPDVLGDVR